MKRKISFVLVALVLVLSMVGFSGEKQAKNETSKKNPEQVEASVKNDEELAVSTEDDSEKYSTGEILKKSGLNTVLGMGIVFLVLIFLALVIGLFKYIPGNLGKKETAVLEPKGETVKEETPIVETIQEINDLELVAVITAAIAAKEGTSSNGFVVRSIKRRTSNRW